MAVHYLSYIFCLLLFGKGPLESVLNLRFVNEASCDSISIAWEAPFSLNLTNAEPDVLYYVDVYNITEGEEIMVESVNIAEEYYNFSHANLSLRQEFNFTVTPVSNVPGAVNGINSQHLQHRLGGIYYNLCNNGQRMFINNVLPLVHVYLE